MSEILDRFHVILRLHLLAALYWTGSAVFLAVVASPIIERIRPPSFQRVFGRRLWEAAHLTMWLSIAVLLGTGALLAMGRVSPADFATIPFWRSTLGMKLLLIFAMIALSLLHDMWLGYGARLRDARLHTEPPGFWGLAIPWIVATGAVLIALLSTALRPTP